MMPGTIPGMARSFGPELNYLGRASVTGSSQNYNFASQPLGSPTQTRLIVVAACGAVGAVFDYSSMTIGGINATTIISGTRQQGSANIALVLAQAIVPNDTTGAIIVRWSRQIARCAIGIWSIDGLQSITPISYEIGINYGGTINLSQNVAANDAIIGASMAYNNDSAVWTGLTENFDNVFSTSRHSGASDLASAAAAPRTMSVAIGGNSIALSAVWR